MDQPIEVDTTGLKLIDLNQILERANATVAPADENANSHPEYVYKDGGFDAIWSPVGRPAAKVEVKTVLDRTAIVMYHLGGLHRSEYLVARRTDVMIPEEEITADWIFRFLTEIQVSKSAAIGRENSLRSRQAARRGKKVAAAEIEDLEIEDSLEEPELEEPEADEIEAVDVEEELDVDEEEVEVSL